MARGTTKLAVWQEQALGCKHMFAAAAFAKLVVIPKGSARGHALGQVQVLQAGQGCQPLHQGALCWLMNNPVAQRLQHHVLPEMRRCCVLCAVVQTLQLGTRAHCMQSQTLTHPSHWHEAALYLDLCITLSAPGRRPGLSNDMTVRQRRVGDATSLQSMFQALKCRLVKPSSTLFSRPGVSSPTCEFPCTSKV